jgi:ABC-type nitrate/sulfonate/bicarbonate transport system substrate-binding protein
MASEQQRKVRLAIGLRSTAQSLSLIGNAASAFSDRGIDLEIAQIETAGPAGIAGLMRGDWEFAEFGAVPVVQWAMEGQDPVILMAAEPVSALYILAAKGVTQPRDLAGGKIGVLTAAGQTGYSAREMLRRWDLSDAVGLAELMRYPAILERLIHGTIRGGVLTADYRFAAPPEAGISVLADLGAEFRFQGPVLATTWQYLRKHRDVVEQIVAGYCQAIHVFKTRPDIVRPVLQQHLPFADAAGVQRIHEFYAERFSRIPRPSVGGLQAVIDSCRKNKPGPRELTVEDVYDPSVLDALERQGLFKSLYQAT